MDSIKPCKNGKRILLANGYPETVNVIARALDK